MLNQLLETIIQILTGWVDKFTSHAQHVEDKLDSLDQTASDIETNTEPISDIKDNTGAVITPIQNIKSNTDSIKQSSQTSANNTTAILNNISTLSTNTGRAAAFAEDCANNTLDIKDKVTTIASDTTQLRADTAELNDMSDKIYEAIKWSLVDKVTTETVEGTDTVSFDTDLTNDLVSLEVGIKAKQDLHGYDAPWVGGAGKNKANKAIELTSDSGITVRVANDGTLIVNGTSTAASFIRGYFNCPDSTATYTWALFNNIAFENGVEFSVRTSNNSSAGGWSKVNTTNKTFTFTPFDVPTKWQFQISSGITFNNAVFKPMIVSGNTAPTDYEPYENICPISGWNAIMLDVNGNTELINLGDTYYGGLFIQEDENRKFEVTKGYIASYNGEVIIGEWLSDSAVYEQGTNPPTGSEVVYPLITPIEIQLTHSQIATIKGINTIITDGNISVTYEESVKHYLDKQDN